MIEEKDVDSQAYKRGWVDGYSGDNEPSLDIPNEDLIQYQYGFDDGAKAYAGEIDY